MLFSLALACGVVHAAPTTSHKKESASHLRLEPSTRRTAAVKSPAARLVPTLPALESDGDAEAKLLAIYRAIGLGNTAIALRDAELLAQKYPNFQLGQLVYGDLLAMQVRPVSKLGDLAADSPAEMVALTALRQESALRLRALRERPLAGNVPSQFAQLAMSSAHAIAIDTSRARLYLFENTASGLHIVADYYISVGRLGIDKNLEGDLRTPLGVYYITGSLSPKTLKPFYGVGALPINYPNPYDVRRGKTGGGIWLHGTPRDQFTRPPLATDGCVVMANQDLHRLLTTVEARSTPVVIADQLQWVPPQASFAASHVFEQSFEAWRAAKSRGDLRATLAYYTDDFTSYDKTLAQYAPSLERDIHRAAGRPLETKDLSFLRWQDKANETMVVTFGEVPVGEQTGPVRRQYWIQQRGVWKIFFEGTIG